MLRIVLLCIGILLAGCGGAHNASYVKNSSDYVSHGIDYHDIEKIIEKNAQSLLNSEYVRGIKGNKLLAISDIINETSEDIDVELVARKLAREIRKSKKFSLTNAIAGSGAKSDKMIKDSRKLTKDSHFNQHSTQEAGTLIAPELSLSGKFIQRSKKINKITRIDYMFLLTLSDLKSGRVLWDHEELISKVTDSLSSSPQKQIKGNASKELTKLRQECADDNFESCQKLLQKEDIEGLTSLCNEQVIAGCSLATAYFAGQNKLTQVKPYAQKGCELGNMLSCGLLGDVFYQSQHYAQAIPYYTKACNGSEAVACFYLGVLYDQGLGVKANIYKALELYTKACDGGIGAACYNMGLIYGNGKGGIKKDYIKAKSYYEKGCALEDGDACANLGALYGNGLGVKQNYYEAKKLYEKGCDLQNAIACYNLGTFYYNGRGVRQDRRKAKELFGKACVLGYQNGCDAYKDTY